MFILNENTIKTPLDEINLINLTFYSSKSEILNIYDTNFTFNENLIPLITSVLEVKPIIQNAKKYCNITSDSLIILDTNISNIPNKSHLQFPSFLHDIQQNGFNMKYIQGYERNLINSLDFDNDLLVRMYKLENKKCEYGQNMLNEEYLILFVWNWDYANVQLIINKNNPTQCLLQMNIYITEDNKIISSKLENINKIICMLSKIKNEIVNCEL